MIFQNDDENLSVFASSSLNYAPVDNDYYIGGFEETRLLNSDSGAADLNGDGDTEDVYHLITFKTSSAFSSGTLNSIIADRTLSARTSSFR